jgi:hypothetical protein
MVQHFENQTLINKTQETVHVWSQPEGIVGSVMHDDHVGESFNVSIFELNIESPVCSFHLEQTRRLTVQHESVLSVPGGHTCSKLLVYAPRYCDIHPKVSSFFENHNITPFKLNNDSCIILARCGDAYMLVGA